MTMRTLVLVFALLVNLSACVERSAPASSSADGEAIEVATQLEVPKINLAHLEHLYDSIQLPNGGTGGVVWIYSEAPDYVLVDDDDEGYTCVDDMARALVVYALHHKLYSDDISQRRVAQLTRTILSLQSENGYFYNFLWPDNTINRTFKTSINEPNWWTWRAFWAFETALQKQLLDARDRAATERAVSRVVANVKRDFDLTAIIQDTIIHGMSLPNDLPEGGGSDQVAVLMVALTDYAERTGDTSVYPLLRGFAERLMAMQTSDARMLSWYNIYHAWGNAQAYALLRTGELLDDETMRQSALRELNEWLPKYLIAHPAAAEFGARGVLSTDTFPQISYGQRGFAWAAAEAFHQTQSEHYAQLAQRVSAWYSADNLANAKMYDAATGRGYDGIISSTEINHNAGAESTIEALLTLLAVQELNLSTAKQ